MTQEIAKQGAALSAILGEDVSDASLTERPAFIPEGDKSGTENIGPDDIRLPRLGIAQGLSPQMTPGNSDYIDGLKMFQMFNDFTKEIYGNGPIYFLAVRRDKRCIEFRPRSEGGGVVNMNVPWDDPRAEIWTERDGQRIPPVATRFNEWIILILKSGGETEPVVLSIKNTNKYNRRAASDLNGMILAHASKGKKSLPIYGVIYKMESKFESNNSGTFGVPVFGQVGFIPNTEIGEKLYERAKGYADSLKGKEVVFTREPGDETDFIESGM